MSRPPTITLLVSVIGLACSAAPRSDDGLAPPRPDQIRIRDAPVSDLSSPPDLYQPDRCQPGCHYDCFQSGGTTCHKGKIYQLAGGARPCCHGDDPWPDDKPICASISLHSCNATSCGSLDPRYAYCIAGPNNRKLEVTAAFKHLLSLYCPEIRFAKPGDLCQFNDDCRPADASVTTSLRCNLSTFKCEISPRPTAPPEYGLPCGLTPADLPIGVTPGEDWVTKGKHCQFCHVARFPQPFCFKQACTIPCKFDEDCPSGASCVCVGFAPNFLYQICATTSDRLTSEGRTSAIGCTPGSDAGPLFDAGTKG